MLVGRVRVAAAGAPVACCSVLAGHPIVVVLLSVRCLALTGLGVLLLRSSVLLRLGTVSAAALVWSRIAPAGAGAAVAGVPPAAAVVCWPVGSLLGVVAGK